MVNKQNAFYEKIERFILQNSVLHAQLAFSENGIPTNLRFIHFAMTEWKVFEGENTTFLKNLLYSINYVTQVS